MESGINSRIRDVLRRRRGLSEEHRKHVVEWFLALYELTLDVGEGFWLRAGWAGRG